MESLIGTTLPHLQCIFHADLDATSGLFLSFGLAAGIACLASIIFLKKCNIYLLMATMMVLFSGGVAMIPVSNFIALGLAAIFCCGFSVGTLLLGSIHICNVLFSKDAFAFHVLSSSLSAGSFLAPIIAKPFLGEMIKNYTMPQQNHNTTIFKTHWEQRYLPSTAANSVVLDKSRNLSESTLPFCENTTSTVKSLYIILGFVGVPLSITYVLLFFRNRTTTTQTEEDSYTKLENEKSKCEIVHVTLLSVLLMESFGLPYAYGSYLVEIGIGEPLHLDIQTMPLLTSLFWLSFFLGRSAAIAVSFKMKQIMILYICFTGEIAAFIFLAVTEGNEIFLWIGSLSLAFFSGPVFSALIAWSRHYTTLSPCVIGILTFADYIGIALLPYISGIFINHFGEKYHDYYCFTLALFQFGIFFGLHVLLIKCK